MFESLREIQNEARDEGARGKKVADSIASLLSAFEQKEIYNADYADHKSRVSRWIEDTGSKLKYQWARELETSQQREDFFAAFPTQSFSLQSIKAYVGRLNAFRNVAPGFVLFVEAMNDLKDILEQLKPHIIKGVRAPKPGAAVGFVKPAANFENKAKIIKFMRQIADDFSDRYRKMVRDRLVNDVMQIEKMDLQSFNDLRKLPADRKMLAQKVVSFKFGRGELNIEWPKIVSDMAEQRVKDVVDHFAVKMADKIALITERKSLTEAKLLKSTVQAGKLENELLFTFDDNSSFRLVSQVEMATSQGGLTFLRFPTRFTDVRLAGGALMSRPSEEKMIKEF